MVVRRTTKATKKEPEIPHFDAATIRPEPIPNGSGADYLRMRHPVRIVELDAGVFDYLWRVVETRLRESQSKSGEIYEAQADMLQRAADEFRRVMAGHLNKLAEPPTTVRRVVRKKK